MMIANRNLSVNAKRGARTRSGARVVAVVGVTCAMLFGVAGAAGALYASFGNGNSAVGTPIDENGERTVCSDGFELLAARFGFQNANGEDAEVGDPTGLTPGTIDQSSLYSVYSADLVDNFGDGAVPLQTAGTAGPADAYIFIDPATGVPPTDFFGFGQVDMINQANFTAVGNLVNPVQAEGSVMFVPTSPLPIGEDVVIVNRDFEGFRENFRRVTVVDCSEPPVDVEVEVEINNNKIRPDKPHQRVRGTIINDGSFDIDTADNLEVAGATPFRVQMTDVDHDGDLDLRFVARNRHTDIECGDTELTITGTIDGEPFETTVDISTKCKNKKKW